MSIYTLNFVSIEFLKSIKVIIIYILLKHYLSKSTFYSVENGKKKKKIIFFHIQLTHNESFQSPRLN